MTPSTKNIKRAAKIKTPAIVEVQKILKEWYDLRFNEITLDVEGRKKVETDFKVLNENNLFVELMNHGYKISLTNLTVLLNSEFIPTYNPFIEYFEGLPKWNESDGDLIEDLANCIKAKDQRQFNLQFKKMLVRTISCAINNHSVNKHAFVLVGGEQHTGKTTFLRYLCPPKLKSYYTEAISTDKDGQISLCENFVINLDELSSLSKFEINHFKSTFSKETVKARRPYARKATVDFRRSSFVGSINDDIFLNDTTGSVRWLCFEISSIDWKYDKMDIDKVWSEAYVLYKSGFDFNLTRQEILENESRNASFQQLSSEYEYIQLYLSPGSFDSHDAFWTTTQIKDYLIDKSSRKADFKNIDKLGKALKQLGYERIIRRTGEYNQPTRGYFVKYFDKE